ncbi:replicative DNA helicase [Alicyclobacillus hesperidum URH17-3-68]|nr:replicative DNA helicase [Alicyclobacillus hesperidum URH17-3-68]
MSTHERINWAIQEIEREGQDLQWWRIARRAGIRGEVAEKLRGDFET